MKFHLVSDVHLECWRSSLELESFFEPVSGKVDLIILAGDIAALWTHSSLYETLLKAAKDAAPHVVTVLGNHEYYHGTWDDTLETAKAICERQDVHLLDINTTPQVEINGFTIWGSTLWTCLGNNNPITARGVRHGLNDYSMIRQNGRLLETVFTFEQYTKTRDTINWDADIIVTHHCPIPVLHSRFPYGPITHGFCSFDRVLETRMLDAKKPQYWLYGHTHDNKQLDIGSIKLVSNCVGYPGEPVVDYKSDLILTLS